MSHESSAHGHSPLAKLALGALGVVYGDIGTSPIYAFRETFAGHHTLEPDKLHIYGVLSLIFWSMMIIVTLKYVTIILRADNKGEGGSLALLALINRSTYGTRRWSAGIVMLGVFATALFYGDSMITPAISVLSAVEGLTTVNTKFQPYVIPLAVGILVGLFAIQSYGTARVGNLFGPVMITYFVTLAVLGLTHLAGTPELLIKMLNPGHALAFFIAEPLPAFIAMGSVVLAVTGAEALYADMGHFGKRPIRFAWAFVVVCLLLNYLGQGAMLLSQPPEQARELVKNPFFYLAPDTLRLPLVLLATCATIIASQAVITGAFSVTKQAVQLGFIPRLRILHTSESAVGQIYIPVINWALMIMVIALVVTFGSSSDLAAAYGIAVTGAMFIDTILLTVVFFALWKWPAWKALPLLGLFFVVDLLYLGSNLLKVPEGGWFPLLVGIIIFALLVTWAKGRKLMLDRMAEDGTLRVESFVASAGQSATRVPGTAVFMTSSAVGVPHSMLHNLKHNKVLHERVILLTVRVEDVPHVPSERRVETEEYGDGFFRVLLRYGFMEEVDVPAELSKLQHCGQKCNVMQTSFFLSRQTLIATARPGMARWRERLFGWMLRNSESAMEFFRIPSNRVVELGSQVEI